MKRKGREGGREGSREEGGEPEFGWRLPRPARCVLANSPDAAPQPGPVGSELLCTSALEIHGKMYERHKRKYSFCSKGERAVDVVLIKVGSLRAHLRAASASVARP